MASSGEGGLRRLTSARDLVEAEMIEQFLLGAGIQCLIRRAPAFDVPEFLAAGRRELLVRAADFGQARALVESHFGLA